MRKILTLLLLSFVTYLSNAQADLICLRITNTQTSISRGNYVSLSFKVKNQGTTLSSLSHASIYLTDSITGTDLYLSLVSIESLAAGDSTASVGFIYPLPYTALIGKKYIKIVVNSLGEVFETNTLNNTKYSQNTFNIISIYGGKQNLPYPIIFIHGLTGRDTTWYPFIKTVQNYYGYSWGGNMDFCLNQDGNVNTAYLPNDFKDWTDLSQLGNGDLYTVNFHIDNTGTKYNDVSQSNQSSIVKQGLAIQKAVEHVLQITGSDKVILVGHSMGGLAAREYLQNSIRWQADGKHHIAKLFTLGTPHGGSNATGYGSAATFTALHEQSEAVRDLRTSYAYTGYSGVYLFGGIEDGNLMQTPALIGPYYNVDVNCNGFAGNSIVGLNNKSIPLDLAYTCIIGNDTYPIKVCNSSSSICDGVVGEIESNLNNYIPAVNADTFYCVGQGSAVLFGGDPWHVLLPKQTDFMLKGIDEPDSKKLAYSINIGKYNFGHFTEKNGASLSLVDSDYYKITIPSSGKFIFNMYNIPTSQIGLKIIDSATNITQTTYYSNGKGAIGLTNNNINPGTYYLNIFSKPDSYSWYFPYAHRVDFTTSIPIVGKVITPKGSIVKNAIVNLLKDSISSMLSDVNGKYNFILSKIGNYTLRPTKNNDIVKANGINATDVLFTQRHILNTTKLNSAYKLIAADVNGDKIINATDVLRIKRLILGTDTTFTKGTGTTKVDRLWEFVDSAYVFPDTTNPFPFKDSISFSNLTSNKINQTFIGVKLGDVNYDWNPAVAKGSLIDNVELIIDNAQWTMDNGQLKIPIKVKNFKDIVAMQYTLHFKNKDYEFVGIENNKLEFDFNSKQANQNGNISFLWTDKNAVERTLEDGTELFTLVLRSTVDRRPSTDLQLTIDNSITEIAAWDKDYNQHHIVISKREPPQTTNIEQWVIYPNPTKGLVNLYIETLIGKGSIVITDLYGKTVKTQALNMGTNKVNIANLSKGVYFVSTITNEGKTTKKLVVE